MVQLLLALLLAGSWAPAALAGGSGTIVWMEPSPPDDERVQNRAERRTGAARHLAMPDLAHPLEPIASDDERRIERLREAIASAEARWHEFEVEEGIAVELEALLDAVDVVPDEQARELLLHGRALQGAAVAFAFDPQTFAQDEAAEPFRATAPALDGLNRPWVLAAALAEDGEIPRGHLGDGATWHLLQEELARLQSVPEGTLELPDLAPGERLVLNGRPVEKGAEALALPFGHHFAHIEREGEVAGRHRLEVRPAESTSLEPRIDTSALQEARAQVLQELTVGFPEEVKGAIDAAVAHVPGPVFVAARDGRQVEVLPYARGARLVEQRVVTFVTAGEIGGGVMASSVFEGDADWARAPTAFGGIGAELGVYNGALLAGVDMAMTPMHGVRYANASGDANVASSALLQPWGGLGAYVLRPASTGPTLLVAGTYGWYAPAHLAFGGRLTLGIPMDRADRWFRVTLGGSTANRSLWDAADEANPMHLGFIRIGFGRRM